jgi:hypothetical protein
MLNIVLIFFFTAGLSVLISIYLSVSQHGPTLFYHYAKSTIRRQLLG